MKVRTPPIDSLSGVSLLSGRPAHWEQREPYNVVLEASIGYAASCGVVVIDEVADLNERVDVRMEEVEGAEGSSWSVESSSRRAQHLVRGHA